MLLLIEIAFMTGQKNPLHQRCVVDERCYVAVDERCYDAVDERCYVAVHEQKKKVQA